MATKNIYDIISVSPAYGSGDADVPSSSKIVESSENNLDYLELQGTALFDINNLDDVIFTDFNGNVIFQGTCRENNDGNTNQRFVFDYSIELGEIPIIKNYEAFTPLQIMEDVITNWTGLTWIAPTGIVDGTAITLYPSKNKKALEIIDDMHKILGTTHYMDVKNFNVEYEGQTLNPIVLEVNNNCMTDTKGWVQDTSQLTGNLTVQGGDYNTTETIFLSGDGVSKEFTLTNPYVDITVEYPIGTELKPQLDGITTGDYNILKEVKKIRFLTITPVSGVNNIKVVLTYQTQANFNIIETTNTQVIAGTNPHHQVLNVGYLKETLQCIDYGNKYKQKFKSPLRDVILFVDDMNLNNYRANQRIRIIDNQHKLNGSYIDGEFLIKKVERNFGLDGYFLTLTCGDSRLFVYDRGQEISRKISDLNNNVPTAEIFNIGIPTLSPNQVDVTFIVTVSMRSGTLPQNILVYDLSRTYVNGATFTTNDRAYKYINGSDYINLFNDI